MDIITRSGSQIDSADNWNRVRGTSQCPICGCAGRSNDTMGCSVRVDRSFVYCGNKRINHATAEGCTGSKNGGGQWLYRYQEVEPGFEYQKLPPLLKPSLIVPMQRWRDLAETAYLCDREQHITRLSEDLGVPTFALDDLRFGYLSRIDWEKELGNRWAIPCDAWCCPERDALGQVLGVLARMTEPDKKGKSKKAVTGSGRALYYSDKLLSTDGPTVKIDSEEVQPILIPEGPTDTAALLSISVPAVGRMNCTHGVDDPGKPPQFLKKMFSETTRQPVILCDNDPPNEHGNRPGFDGGVATAQKLANALRRPVYWAMPPDDAKDARSWLNDNLPNAADLSREYLEPIGTGFLAVLEYHRVDPEGLKVLPYETPDGLETDLDTLRDQLAQDRIESLDGNDINLSRVPCGGGKSHADKIALSLMNGADHRTVFIVPTHENVQAALKEYQEVMPAMVAWPRIDESTCQKFHAVERSRKLGLSPGRSCCVGCEHLEGCKYKQLAHHAKDANHLIITRAMATYQPDLLRNRDYLSVHEDVVDLFKGHVKVNPEKLDLIGAMLLSAADKEEAKEVVDHFMIQWLRSLEQLAVWLQSECEKIKKGEHPTQTLDMPQRFENIPENWEMKLSRLAQGVMTDMSLRHIVKINRDAATLLYLLAEGRVDQLVLQVDKPGRDKQKDKDDVPLDPDVNNVYIVATWDQQDLPPKPTKWIADATLRPELIETLTQQTVIDKTPPGRLPHYHSLRQLTWDVTQRTTAKSVAAMLLAIVDVHKDHSRFGLITHQKHVKALFTEKGSSRDELDDETRALFHKVVYFGQGPDRADNSWYQDCDFLIVLGTPRPNPSDTMTRLIVMGDLESATDPDRGSWAERNWTGATADDERFMVPAKGYDHPAWRQAYEDITHASLIQASGRTRSILEDGIPGLVCTNENLGKHLHLVDHGQYQMVTRAVSDAALAVSHCEPTPIVNITIGGRTQREGASTSQIADRLGIQPPGASKLLKRAAAAGRIFRAPTRKGGWLSHHREMSYRRAEQKAEQKAAHELMVGMAILLAMRQAATEVLLPDLPVQQVETVAV